MEFLIIVAIMIFIMVAFTRMSKRKNRDRIAAETEKIKEKYMMLYQSKRVELLSSDFVKDLYYALRKKQDCDKLYIKNSEICDAEDTVHIDYYSLKYKDLESEEELHLLTLALQEKLSDDYDCTYSMENSADEYIPCLTDISSKQKAQAKKEYDANLKDPF